ncbi:MAG: phosphate acyltransferase PlsX [Rickettsiales bacterium]|jgi:glycerol-3-phosphate acyltransferase PlsX|nr:phosphate acyltransferase PlsX [Rickettsiales bacterium]
MEKKITIAVDCMGGDNAPSAVIGGIDLLLKRNSGIFFLLYGDKNKIESCLARKPRVRQFSKVVHTDIFVDANEKPHIAVRQKDTSVRLAIESVKNGEADAVISAGNTGAYMAVAKLILKTIVGIDRPALIQLMPSLGAPVAFLDMGANLECNSTNLYQFAFMGSAFYRAVNDIENPSVAILNIGSEEMKGSDVVKNTSILLRESVLKNSYKGYIESNNVLNGTVNVVVTDGWTGNIALKAIEGASKTFMSIIKSGFKSGFFPIIGYILASRGIKKAKEKVSHKRYNGAMLVGVNGIVVKSHGNADEESFSYAIKNTINLIKNKVNDNIISYIQVAEEDERID